MKIINSTHSFYNSNIILSFFPISVSHLNRVKRNCKEKWKVHLNILSTNIKVSLAWKKKEMTLKWPFTSKNWWKLIFFPCREIIHGWHLADCTTEKIFQFYMKKIYNNYNHKEFQGNPSQVSSAIDQRKMTTDQ